MLIAAACTQRTVCPAYQSAFIYDKDQLRKKFSYFVDDTTPKVYTASKNKYLIAEAMPYQKKLRTMNTVPMKPVMVAVPDSISGKGSDVSKEALDSAARSVIDSIFIVDEPVPDSSAVKEDSAYVISKDREIRVLKYNMPDSLVYDSVQNKYVRQKPAYYIDEVGFNTEQDNYMWYLRHSLLLPDVRLSKLQEGGEAAAPDQRKKEKKGFFGFFKNMFRKKPADVDSAEVDVRPRDEQEFDFIDTTAVEEPVFEEPRSKKEAVNEGAKDTDAGIDPAADRPKKKKKKSKKTEPKRAPEKKKEEDTDDGF